MPTTLPRNIREAWGEEIADDFAQWLDKNFQERAVSRGEYREVLSRLDVIEERFDGLEKRFDERFNGVEKRFDGVEKRFDSVERRFEGMDEKLDRMNDRILSMTRWLIGLLLLFGTMVTVLLSIAEFTG